MSKINILTLNVNGLRANTDQKLYEIRNLVSSYYIDLVFLQETHVENRTLSTKIQNKLQCCNAIWSFGSSRSSGVAIFNFNPNITFSKYETDYDGRIICADFQHNNIIYRALNIYGPIPDSEKCEFFNSLFTFLTGQHNLIVAGDFNCVLNSNLDRIGNLTNYSDKSIHALRSLISNFKLIDTFRKLNPLSKSYTWHRISLDPSVPPLASRLDRIYVSKNIADFILNSTIVNFTQSDHDAAILSITSNSLISYGAGYWKCNNSFKPHQFKNSYYGFTTERTETS